MSAPSKVTVIFKHVGNAPVLQSKRQRITFNESDPFVKIIGCLRAPKQLDLSSDTPLFVYLKNSFVPQPTEQIGTLADSFGFLDNGNKNLIVSYSITPAWG